MDDSQLLKGILEGCVLYIISRGQTYGYELMTELENKGFKNLPEGTLYPILNRLDKNGDINCCRKKSSIGPIRKYYSITEDGLISLEKFKASYKSLTETVENVFQNKNTNNKITEN